MTQKQQVAQHLKQYGSITDMRAFMSYKIRRLSSIIMRLRRSGIEIETELVGEKRYAKYILK